MESVKKLLPYLLIAIVFAIGGYFVGHGKLSDQGAALYQATNRASIKDPNISSTGPTGGEGPMLRLNGGPVKPSGIVVWITFDSGGCEIHTYDGAAGTTTVVDGHTTEGGGCAFLHPNPNSPSKAK